MSDTVSSPSIIERLRAHPMVEYAFADTRERLLAIPNDPLYSQQTYLKAPDARPGSSTASSINAPPADTSISCARCPGRTRAETMRWSSTR